MINIRSDEISNIIQAQLKFYNKDIQTQNIGTVFQIGDGIVQIHGLNEVVNGELINFGNKIFGIALNLEENSVGVVLLNKTSEILEGHKVKTTGKVAQIPVGDNFLGRIINPLGLPLDNKGLVKSYETRTLEIPAPSIIDRESICKPLHTGIKTIDSLIPIGRGQRELIIGNRQTGKTSIAVDTIINQKNENIICIYVGIGQKSSTISQVISLLNNNNCLFYTIIIVSTASDTASMQYIAPYSGATLAEYFMYKGKETLIVYDDLTKHAIAYRQMSLLLRRPAGREAYPGDIFYLHSRLLERSAKLKKELGGGSMTALPIIETQDNDVSAYIPTNIISITDGQIFLSNDLFNSGIRPAIDIGLSVSRVGSSAQTDAMKSIANRLKLELTQFIELETFSQFASDLDKNTQNQLERGIRLRELLNQPAANPLSLPEQISLIYAGINGFLDDLDLGDIKLFMEKLLFYLNTSKKSYIKSILITRQFTKYIESILKESIMEVKKEFTSII